MKRSWIGFFLLLFLLLAGIFSSWTMVHIHRPIEENLQHAADRALQEDWEKADRYFKKAHRDWETWKSFRACFADHNPVEEIDAFFQLLTVDCAAREPVAFAGSCRQLARLVAAVGEAHELGWQNLL